MILMIAANARKMLDKRNAMRVQLVFRTDARLHEHPRCIDRAERQDCLALGRKQTDLAIDNDLDTGYALAIEDKARDQRVGQHR
ncbi:hypothetical protein D3C72_2168250 [compost metagenome]